MNTFSNEFLSFFKQAENANPTKGGGKIGDKWFPHKSPEAGTDTIGYGHKLTVEEARNKAITLKDGTSMNFRHGLSTNQVEILLQNDLSNASKFAKDAYDKMQGRTKPFDSLGIRERELLTEVQYNVAGGVKTCPNMCKNIANGNWNAAVHESHRSYFNKDLQKMLPLTLRNKQIDDFFLKESSTTGGVELLLPLDSVGLIPTEAVSIKNGHLQLADLISSSKSLVTTDDLAVALYLAYHRSSAAFSLDPFDSNNPSGPWMKCVYLSDQLRKELLKIESTQFAQTLFEADWLMKQLSIGVTMDTLNYDQIPNLPLPLRIFPQELKEKGFCDLFELSLGDSKWTRMWITIDSASISKSIIAENIVQHDKIPLDLISIENVVKKQTVRAREKVPSLIRNESMATMERRVFGGVELIPKSIDILTTQECDLKIYHCHSISKIAKVECKICNSLLTANECHYSQMFGSDFLCCQHHPLSCKGCWNPLFIDPKTGTVQTHYRYIDLKKQKYHPDCVVCSGCGETVHLNHSSDLYLEGQEMYHWNCRYVKNDNQIRKNSDEEVTQEMWMILEEEIKYGSLRKIVRYNLAT